MSASQPETASDHNDANDSKGSIAEFPMVRRGYDRHLVDVRVAELVDQLSKQRQRADEAGARAQAAIDGAETEAASRRKAAEDQASSLEQSARETLAQAETERSRI